MLVGDFTAAESCLRALVAGARGSGLVLKTNMLIHPMERPEGGLTQIESRVFHELAMGAGASKAVVWTGAALGDAEVAARLKGG